MDNGGGGNEPCCVSPASTPYGSASDSSSSIDQGEVTCLDLREVSSDPYSHSGPRPVISLPADMFPPPPHWIPAYSLSGDLFCLPSFGTGEGRGLVCSLWSVLFFTMQDHSWARVLQTADTEIEFTEGTHYEVVDDFHPTRVLFCRPGISPKEGMLPTDSALNMRALELRLMVSTAEAVPEVVNGSDGGGPSTPRTPPTPK